MHRWITRATGTGAAQAHQGLELQAKGVGMDRGSTSLSCNLQHEPLFLLPKYLESLPLALPACVSFLVTGAKRQGKDLEKTRREHYLYQSHLMACIHFIWTEVHACLLGFLKQTSGQLEF